MLVFAVLLFVTPPGPRTSNPLKIAMGWALKGYKQLISPAQGPQICNFQPSCSQFTRESIETYGPFWGVVMGGDRLLRCNGFAPTYFDRFYYGVANGRIYDPPGDHYLPHYDHHILHPDPDREPR